MTRTRAAPTYLSEIGDIVQIAPGSNPTAEILNGYYVQAEWSDYLNQSLLPPPDAVSMTRANLAGVGNYEVALTSQGVLRANGGSGWYTLDTGVQSYAVGKLGSTTYIFDLNATAC